MKKNIAIGVLIALLLIGVGFLLGRWTQEQPKPKIEYIKGETIRDSIPYPIPVAVEVPAKPILPMKPDTLRLPGEKIYVAQVVDTAQIIAEFIQKRTYKETLLNQDTIGTLIVDAVVQYNTLQHLGYEFTPVHKQITLPKKPPLFTPYVHVSVSTLGYYGLGGGVYIKNTGLGVRYVTDFYRRGWEFGLQKKF